MQWFKGSVNFGLQKVGPFDFRDTVSKYLQSWEVFEKMNQNLPKSSIFLGKKHENKPATKKASCISINQRSQSYSNMNTFQSLLFPVCWLPIHDPFFIPDDNVDIFSLVVTRSLSESLSAAGLDLVVIFPIS